MNGKNPQCVNAHDPDETIACWSPGGPCPDGRTVCELCGPCATCNPGQHPQTPADGSAATATLPESPREATPHTAVPSAGSALGIVGGSA